MRLWTQRVVSGPAAHLCPLRLPADQLVGSVATGQPVRTRPSAQHVLPGAPIEGLGVIASDERIVAVTSAQVGSLAALPAGSRFLARPTRTVPLSLKSISAVVPPPPERN